MRGRAVCGWAGGRGWVGGMQVASDDHSVKVRTTLGRCFLCRACRVCSLRARCEQIADGVAACRANACFAGRAGLCVQPCRANDGLCASLGCRAAPCLFACQSVAVSVFVKDTDGQPSVHPSTVSASVFESASESFHSSQGLCEGGREGRCRQTERKADSDPDKVRSFVSPCMRVRRSSARPTVSS